MTRLSIALVLAFGLIGAMGVGASAQSAEDVCAFIDGQLRLAQDVESTLCNDLTAGIDRGHLQASRALALLQEVAARLSGSTENAAASLLSTVGTTVNPAKNDLPAELLISRVLSVFGQVDDAGQAMSLAASEVNALHQALLSVAQTYQRIDIHLASNMQSKVLRTEFGDVKLTVGRVDTAITATAMALDRFERRLNRPLDDVAAMKSAVMDALARPSFAGAQALPDALIRYIGAKTDGQQWASVVRFLADARGRDN
ncbi:MAG: hypothetical protein ABEK03_05740 [Candidatus Bipolaricaulia bacterium]